MLECFPVAVNSIHSQTDEGRELSRAKEMKPETVFPETFTDPERE
jgi:hypothetical protein